MTRKVTSKRSIICVIMLFGFISAIFFNCYTVNNLNVFANELNAAVVLNDIYIDLNTDNVYNDLTIRDYPARLHATKARVSSYLDENNETRFKLNGLAADDPIIHIVPKSCFFTEGQVLAIGEEYGYFINTEINVRGNYFSTVLVFDISTNTDLIETIDRVIVEVKPVFQYKYIGLTDNASNEMIDGKNFEYDAMCAPCVVAQPSEILFSEKIVKYEMVDDYYLKDVSFGASLYNEQALNRGDIGYNPYDDYGSYFTGVDYSYQGKYREYEKFDVENLIWTIIDTSVTLVGFIDQPISLIGNVVKNMSPLYSLVSTGKGWAEVISNFRSSTDGNVVETEKKITATCYYQNRDDQLAHYKDLDDNPVLVKNALCLVDTGDEKSMWYGVGNNVTAYFNIGHSALNGRTPYYTRFIDQLALQIVREADDEVVAAGDTIIQDTLRTPETKEVDFMGTSSVYMMSEGQDHFIYDNIPYGGNYNVNVNLSGSATVTVNGVTQTGSNLSFNTFVNQNGNIAIDLSENAAGLIGSTHISLNDGLTVNSILPGGKYLLKTNLDGVKTLTTGNQNLVIENIYLYDNGFKPYRSYVDFSEGVSVTYPFESGRDYYIVLRNDGVASISGITLSVNELRTVPVNEDVTINADTKAFAFVNTYTDTDAMSFQFTIPQSSDRSLTIYNQNGNAIGVSTILTTGNIKLSFTIGAGEKVYIFCSLNTSLPLKITTDSTYLKWEIDGVVQEGYTFTLPRGTTYNLRLLYVKDGVAKELDSEYNLHNQDNYYTFNAPILTMTYAVPYEYVITLIPLSYPNATLRIIPTLGREDIEYTVTLDKNYGNGGSDSVIANYNKNMPAKAVAPTRTGYTFTGYFSERYN